MTESPYTVHTRAELTFAEGENVMVLGNSKRPGVEPGTVYRGTGEDAPDEAWIDDANGDSVSSAEIKLPALVFFTPKVQ